MSIATDLTTIAENVPKVYEAGKQKQEEEFWDIVSRNWTRKHWGQAFRYWDCEYIHPPKQIKPTQECTHMFAANPSLKKIEKKYFDFSSMSLISAQDMCQGCPSLEVFEDVGLPAMTNYNYIFSSDRALKTIECLRFSDKTISTTNTFVLCDSLENITIEGEICISIDFQWSKLLTKSSIESIITHLSDTTTTDATLTLSAEAVNREFPGEGEWDLFLVENKPSVWSIYLV